MEAIIMIIIDPRHLAPVLGPSLVEVECSVHVLCQGVEL